MLFTDGLCTGLVIGKERRPNEVLALGMTRAIYLLERMLRVGAAMVTYELRRRGFTWQRLIDDMEPVGLAKDM